jgi:flagellar biosynthesis protein FlhF
MIKELPQSKSRGKYSEPPKAQPETTAPPVSSGGVSREAYNELRQELRTQLHKIELLERKIQEISQSYHLNPKNVNEAQGVFQLRTTLKTLDVDDAHILDIIKKANYELSRDDLDNPDVIFEFALKEMASSINTAVPLFAKVESPEPVITVLISEAASGQTTIGTKIAVLKKDVVLVQYSQEAQSSTTSDFATQVFGIQTEKPQSFSEAIGICRKATEAGKSVLLDVRLNGKFLDETKKFIETLKRGFHHVEVLCTLSAIHSELYNRKIIARYKDVVDGVIISHVDLCMNFGALFNVHKAHNKLPLKFFGTGPVVPDDIEGATAERLMAGLFQF